MTHHDRIDILHLSEVAAACSAKKQAHLDPEALLDDLAKASQEFAIGLVIATGDFAQSGKTSEFEIASEFFRKLLHILGLNSSRLIVVPGNQDINPLACRAYINDCEADEVEPLPPYWPKWRQYVRFFADLYLDHPSFVFSEAQPWTLFEVPELRLVVAGLNSTMAETHQEGHYGYLGEGQIRWFDKALEQYRQQEWLRIGAVHHNVLRRSGNDSENLVDARDLERMLGGNLHLLLHGHAEAGGVHWLGKLPSLAAGAVSHPNTTQVANVPSHRYQILCVERDRIRRWSRICLPERQAWGSDCSSFQDERRDHIPLSTVGGTFSKDLSVQAKREWRSAMHLHDDFLAQVGRIYELRHPGARVQRVEAPASDISYLSVTREAAGIVVAHPLGAHEGDVSPPILESFLTVHRRYRQADSGCRSIFVYSGLAPDPQLEAALHSEGLVLVSFLDYQGLIDFRQHVHAQNRKLERSDQYPPDLYVRQRMEYRTGGDGEARRVEDALEEIHRWLVHGRHGQFVLVLGDFGTGKTFLLRKLALRLGQEPSLGLVPLLIELRSLEKASDLDVLIAQHLARSGMEQIDLKAFRYMLREGRMALLFDGFDELALRVTYPRAAEHLDTILQAAGGQAKVILTSRTQHFESDEQVRTALGKKVETLPSQRVVHLQPFEQDQIHRFLVKLMRDEEKAGERLRLLQEIPDLIGLSKNPRLLGFIAQLDEEDLRKAREQRGVISAAELYRLILTRWLEGEVVRVQPKGAAPPLSLEARWAAVTSLALKLWTRTERALSLDELTHESAEALRSLETTGIQPEMAAFQVGSGTLLIRDEEGAFSFVHPSVLEWLVAKEAARRLAEAQDDELLGWAEMSALMLDFFCDLAGRDRVIDWAREVSSAEVGSEGDVEKKNAQALLRRLGVVSQGTARFDSLDLRGKDFSGATLATADFSDVDAREALFRKTDLTEVRFCRADLQRADFTDASLVRADLTSADLSFSRLLGADLMGAQFEAAELYRAALVGAKNLEEGVLPYQGLGAAPPSPERVEPWMVFSVVGQVQSLAWSPRGDMLAVARGASVVIYDSAGEELRRLEGHVGDMRSVSWSPWGDRLASGGGDGSVRVWSLARPGEELLQLRGHKRGVLSVSWSPSGDRLASGGADGSVRVWSLASGEELLQLRGHEVSVSSVSWSPSGDRLASGGDEGSVRVWSLESGEELLQLRGHEGGVSSVSWSPLGDRLASSGGDGSVRVWSLASGEEVSQLCGHDGWVQSVSWSPSGDRLVSGGRDGWVRVWSLASGEELLQRPGHEGGVSSVSWSPSGDRLASGGDDRSVRVWSSATGEELLQLRGHEDWIGSVSWSPSGDRLASGGGDGSVRVWSLASGEELSQLRGHELGVLSVSWSPAGDRLASGGDDGTIRVWSLESGEELLQLRGHEGFVWSVSWSPSEDRLASGGDDGSVRVWNASNGGELACLRTPGGPVYSVTFSPDDRHIAAARQDGTITIWEVETGEHVATLAGFEEGWVAFKPDGRFKLGGDVGNNFWHTVGLVRFAPGELDPYLPKPLRMADDEPLF